jgi:hypothetical protein
MMPENNKPVVHNVRYTAKEMLQWYTGNGTRFEYTHNLGGPFAIVVTVEYQQGFAVVQTRGTGDNHTVTVVVPTTPAAWLDDDYAALDNATQQSFAHIVCVSKKQW